MSTKNKFKKKKPGDYPLLAIRLDEETKSTIMSDITALASEMNKSRAEDEYILRKNDIFIEAIEYGINRLKKKYLN